MPTAQTAAPPRAAQPPPPRLARIAYGWSAIWLVGCAPKAAANSSSAASAGDETAASVTGDGQAGTAPTACKKAGPEICDGIDNDCNGAVDDGFVLSCAPCPAGKCVQATIVGGGWRNGVARNLRVGNDVGIALPPLPNKQDYIYIANSDENTLSKLRAADGKEIARLAVGLNPSRTAVDGDGNAWVAMRGVIADDEVLENLVKVDGACTPKVAPPTPTRECILLDTPKVGNTLRGLAVDAHGDVWTGSFFGKEVVHVDGKTGQILDRIKLVPAGQPYGLAVDQDGFVWVAVREGDAHVYRIDPELRKVTVALKATSDLDNQLPYGMAVDGDGNLWFGTNNGTVFSVDVKKAALGKTFQIGGATRGVAIDDGGFLWVADSSLNQLLKMERSTGKVALAVGVGSGPVGVAVDHDGNIWSANQGSANATKVAPDGKVLGTFPVGLGPYTYSDMTGTAFRVFKSLRGTYTATYATGRAGAKWTHVSWQGQAPPPASVTLRLRAGDGDLAKMPMVEVPLANQEASLALQGQNLEVEVTLQSTDRQVVPNVERVVLTWQQEAP